MMAQRPSVSVTPQATGRPKSFDADSWYAQLAQEYGPALARIARAHEADEDLRRDLHQELHVALWRSLNGYDGRCSPRTRVYRVAHNTAVTYVTRRSRFSHGVLCTLDEVDEKGLLTESDSSTSGADYDQSIARLHSLIRLHQRSLVFHRTVWRQDMAELMGCAIVALAIGFQLGSAPNALTKLGELLAILCAITAAFYLRRFAATRPSDTSTGTSLLVFHIAELRRRRDLLRSVWHWIVVPIIITIWIVLAGFVQARPGSAGALVTFASIMTVIGIVLSIANIRGARRLQRDIDALVPLGTDLSS